MPFAQGRGHWVLAEVLRRAGELDAADAEIQIAFALLEAACPVDLPGALPPSRPCGWRRGGRQRR